MLDLHPINVDLSLIARTEESRHAGLLNSAIGLFNAAHRRGLGARVTSVFLGRAWQLLRLSDITASQVRDRHYAGIRCVPITQICGSMDRVRDFDRHFHPLSDRLRDRWVSVAMARCQGIPLPAVSLVQVTDRYFVEDGHHRLSVARALNECAIDAEVMVWDVSGPLPWAERRTRRPQVQFPDVQTWNEIPGKLTYATPLSVLELPHV